MMFDTRDSRAFESVDSVEKIYQPWIPLMAYEGNHNPGTDLHGQTRTRSSKYGEGEHA